MIAKTAISATTTADPPPRARGLCHQGCRVATDPGRAWRRLCFLVSGRWPASGDDDDPLRDRGAGRDGGL
ncbi:MAG: hypothetical protein ACLQT7_08690 [Candidatus Dormibacteria bacterium]